MNNNESQNDQKYITFTTKKRVILKNGDIKVYESKGRRMLKGYLRSDGTRKSRPIFTNEQKDDIIKKYKMGVKIKIIQEEYNTNYTIIRRIIDEFCV